MSARVKEKMMACGYPPLHLERRAKPRVAIPFPATVFGRDQAGAPFEVSTAVDNLCHGGLYLKITRDVGVGSRLLIHVLINPEIEALGAGGLSLEVYGLVKRVDLVAEGYGVAVSFTSGVLI